MVVQTEVASKGALSRNPPVDSGGRPELWHLIQPRSISTQPTIPGFIVFFRFTAGLMLVVIVSLAGVWLEKQTLEMRREVSVQYYQTDVLFDLLVRLRLETQQLTAPAQMALAERTKQGSTGKLRKTDRLRNRNPDHSEDSADSTHNHLPLLRFQHPFNPEGID